MAEMEVEASLEFTMIMITKLMYSMSDSASGMWLWNQRGVRVTRVRRLHPFGHFGCPFWSFGRHVVDIQDCSNTNRGRYQRLLHSDEKNINLLCRFVHSVILAHYIGKLS